MAALELFPTHSDSRRWHLFASAFLFSAIRPNLAKIREINVARKIVFDIFRAPFDRNKCAAILAESI
jgi:hypothetical protein